MNLRRLSPLLWPLLLTGCHPGAPSSDANSATPAATLPHGYRLNSAREALNQIPPPSRGRYEPIRTADNWSNPFLIVGKANLTLRIYYPDAAANGTLPGNALPNAMFRPAGARRRELDIRLTDLPEALAALPADCWPLGRVIAVEEDPTTQRKDRPAMRRTEEAADQLLNDLGIVINDWPPTGTGLLH
jgi:hypothetical protein